MRRNYTYLFLLLPLSLFFFSQSIIAQSPGGVSAGLRLWVKANGNVITSGSNVTTWEDHSPGARHLTSASSYQPAFTTASPTFNFNPSITFASDYLRYAGNVLSVDSDGSVFTVANQTGGSGYNTLWDFYTNAPTLNTYSGKWLFWHVLGVQHNVALTKGEATLTTARWQHNQAATSNLGINGTAQVLNRAVKTNGNNYFLGAGSTIATEAWGGSIAENIVYETSLAGDDLIRVQSYLALKYGITLDNDPTNPSITYDYKASSGTTIWDGTTNASYHNRITGIGRDDNSALLQLKSKSVHSGAMLTLEAPSFSTDGSFLLTGDNNGAASLNIPYSPNFSHTVPHMRFARTWKVQETGETGTISISVNSSSATHILISNSETFSPGTTMEIALTGNAASVNLSDGQYFTFAGPATGPGGVFNNLAVWLRADAGTNTTENGQAISTWEDQSGNSRTHEQATASKQPSYVGAGGSYLMNYNPALRFAGVANLSSNNDYLSTPNFLSSSDAVHVFSVSRIESNTITSWKTVYSFTADVNHVDWYTEKPGIRIGAAQKENTSHSVKYALSSVLMPKSGDHRIIWNGTSQSSSNTYYLIDDILSPDFTLGADRNNTDPMTGDIQEVIIYTGPGGADFSNPAIARIQSYLALKYGISLDPAGQADYTASNGSTIFWQGSQNSGYQQHIFGLGRDDQSTLYQRQAYSMGDSTISISLGELAALNSLNTGTIEANYSFLMLGDNGAEGFNTGISFSAGHSFANNTLQSRINAVTNRIWKAQATTKASWVINLYNNRLQHVNYVLVSSDPSFPSATTRIYPVQNGVATDVEINNGEYMRLGAMITAPGGVAQDLVFWVKSDNAIEGAAWTDNSIYGNPIERVGTPSLATANAAHNYYPYYTGFSTSNYFKDGAASFTPSDNTYGTHTRTSFSVYSAVRSTAAQGSGSGRIIGIDDDNLYAAEPGFSIQNGAPYFYKYYEGTGANKFSTAVTSSKSSVLGFIADQSANSGNGTMQIAKDGISETFNRSSGNDFHNLGQNLVLGYGTWDISGAFPGDIMEVAWYKRALSANENARVSSYLALKNGATLGTSASPADYLNSSSDIVWTGDAAFQYNIAGIGRDDMQGLNQKQANSVNILATGQISIGLGDIAASNAANTNSFLEDKSFLIWGDNGNATDNTTVVSDYGVGITINHLQRVWKIENNGVNQPVYISFPASLQPGELVPPCEHYRLLISNSPTITGSSITSIVATEIVGGKFELSYTFPEGTSYFTLAIVDPSSAGKVYLPQDITTADNYGICSDTEWKYFYEDALKTRKLFSVTGFANNSELDELSISITPSGASFSGMGRESNLMPRITTVTDASAGTYTGIKVRVYYDPAELAATQLPGAATNDWFKYEGDANELIEGILNNGLLTSNKAIRLIPDASGIEDGVSYVEFHNITSFSSFLYLSSTAPVFEVLPVRLHHFTAKQNEQAIVLNWKTTGEQNNNRFEIERQQPGGGWEYIGYVSAASLNDNTAHNYTFIDNAPVEGINLYRLKQIDNDGKFIYSPIVSVKIDKASAIPLFPNPLHSGPLSITGLRSGDFIKVFSSSGNIIYQQVVTGPVLQLNIDNIATGVYHIQVTSAQDKPATYRFLKLK